MCKGLERLERTWKYLERLGRTWKDLEGLKGLNKNWKYLEGLGRARNNLKGLERTGKDLKGSKRTWKNLKNFKELNQLQVLEKWTDRQTEDREACTSKNSFFRISSQLPEYIKYRFCKLLCLLQRWIWVYPYLLQHFRFFAYLGREP